MRRTGPSAPDNISAKIIRGKMPAVKVYEDDRVLAFMDVFPQAEGHLLVISKASQARNLLEAEPEVLEDLALATQRLARAATRALQCDGITITQFNGTAAGQTVFHLHFHVIPRWADRPLAGHASGKMEDPVVLQDLADRIAAAL